MNFAEKYTDYAGLARNAIADYPRQQEILSRAPERWEEVCAKIVSVREDVSRAVFDGLPRTTNPEAAWDSRLCRLLDEKDGVYYQTANAAAYREWFMSALKRLPKEEMLEIADLCATGVTRRKYQHRVTEYRHKTRSLQAFGRVLCNMLQ